MIEGNSLTLEKIIKSAGSCDKDMGGSLETSHLDIDFISTGCDFEEDSLVGILSKFKKSLMDLFGELTGRSKNETLDLFILGVNVGEQGEAKSGSFTSSRLSLRYEIMSALEKVRDGLRLHRSRFLNPQFIETLDKVGGYAKGFEVTHKPRM